MIFCFLCFHRSGEETNLICIMFVEIGFVHCPFVALNRNQNGTICVLNRMLTTEQYLFIRPHTLTHIHIHMYARALTKARCDDDDDYIFQKCSGCRSASCLLEQRLAAKIQLLLCAPLQTYTHTYAMHATSTNHFHSSHANGVIYRDQAFYFGWPQIIMHSAHILMFN